MGTEERPIRIACVGCRKQLKIAQRHAGKRLKCPGCGTAVEVPSASPVPEVSLVGDAQFADQIAELLGTTAPAPLRPVPLPERGSQQKSEVKSLTSLIKELQGEFKKPRTSLGYVLVSIFVVAVMLLLPVLYVAMIAVVAWGTYLHAMHGWGWVGFLRGRAAIYGGALYFGLMVIGVLWVLSMIKPFFRWGGRSETRGGLSRSEEPLLYEFSQQLAKLVGAPNPDFITLTPDVNASAGIERGLFGLFRKRFVLSLGLPLIAGLTVSEIAGVIAHEFGHFSQSRGTLIQRIIERINSWFIQSIYRRDLMDDLIDQLNESGFLFASIIGFIAWMLVGLGRGVLWCLMWVGFAISGTLSRQMEFDADQYATGIAGSKTYSGIFRRLTELSIADELATKFVMTSLSENHLPKDLPSFTAGLSLESSKIRKTAAKQISEERASWVSTHPTMENRIAAIMKLNQPGLLHSQVPARALLRDYQKDAEGWTQFLYMLRFKREIDTTELRPAKEALENYLSVMGGQRAAVS